MKWRWSARNRIIDQRRKKEQQTAFVQGARIRDRDSSIVNLIPQTYEILFPPENQTFEEYKKRLEQADPKCNDNVPLEEIETFVNDVIKMAEQLVRKYNQE